MIGNALASGLAFRPMAAMPAASAVPLTQFVPFVRVKPPFPALPWALGSSDS